MIRVYSPLRRALDTVWHGAARPGRLVRWPMLLGALLLVTSTASVVATQNTAPTFAGIRQSDRSIAEGESVTLVGVFNDPDTTDTHTLLVYWYGGDSNEKQKIQIPAGQRNFEVSHTYAYQLPRGSIKLVIFDHTLPEGTNDNTTGISHDTEFLPFEVRNVAPTIDANSIRVNKSAHPKVVVEGDIVEPGTNDAVFAWAGWSDSSAPATKLCVLSNGNRHFRCEHTYPKNYGFGIKRTYAIKLIVKDVDGGMSEQATSVTLP